MNTENFIEQIKTIVYQTLNENSIFSGQFTYGTIEKVNGNGTVNVFIEGNTQSVKYVHCNPDAKFNTADRVIILYVNNNKNNAFVLCRRE